MLSRCTSLLIPIVMLAGCSKKQDGEPSPAAEQAAPSAKDQAAPAAKDQAAPAAQALSPDFLHGAWCQIVMVEDEEERHTWTIQPDGVFLRHFKHNKPRTTTWTLTGNELMIPELGRLKVTRISDDEFQFKQFVMHRVVRGACREPT